MKIYWATTNCLLDTSSGASLAVYHLLKQLHKRGHQVSISGCTSFDHANGISKVVEYLPKILANIDDFVTINDEELTHELYVTKNFDYDQISLFEASAWAARVVHKLKSEKPDILFHYGNGASQNMIASAARDMNIPVVKYLGNNSYGIGYWYELQNSIITDSQATRELYLERGIDAQPVGMFIDENITFVPKQEKTHEVITFVNPVWSKGAGIVLQVADYLAVKRPEIKFEIWQSRGNWNEIVSMVKSSTYEIKSTLENVEVKKNTSQPSEIYKRTRLLLAPSIFYESAGRVVAEALLNSCPAIVTKVGGLPEMLGEAGTVISLPKDIYETNGVLLEEKAVSAICGVIEKYFDDEAFYQEKSVQAKRYYNEKHSLRRNVSKVETIFERIKN